MIKTVKELNKELRKYASGSMKIIVDDDGNSYTLVDEVEIDNELVIFHVGSTTADTIEELLELRSESKTYAKDDILSEIIDKINEANSIDLDGIRKKQEKEGTLEDMTDPYEEAKRLSAEVQEMNKKVREYVMKLRPSKNTPGYMMMDAKQRKEFDDMTEYLRNVSSNAIQK